MNRVPEPSPQRLSEIFLALARIKGPSRKERLVGAYVRSFLEGLRLVVSEDDTGSVIGGDCGNLWCTVRGSDGEPSLALGAHLDTVEPGEDPDPVLGADGVFRNAGGGILGADNRAAIAAVLHAVELLLAAGEEFPPFELLFTVCEEQGLVGAKHLEPSMPRSPLAAVFDSAGPVGGMVVKAPSQCIVRATFKGQAAHAGVEPELGRNAIVAAAKAVAKMTLGRLDAETTANLGTIHGGVATNVVPEWCRIEGECRGHDDERLAEVAAGMVDALHEGAALEGVDIEVSLAREFTAFSLNADAPVVRLARAAVEDLGLESSLKTAGGGSDANVLNARGIPTVNLDAGMMRVHSPEESLALPELSRLCEVILRMIMLAPEYSPVKG